MSEFENLDQRLQAALERIEKGVANQTTSQGIDPEEVNRLKAALADAERATSEADDRLAAQKADHHQALARLEEGLQAQRQTGMVLDAELQRLREVNQQLTENNRALREACESGQVDAALINQAMLAELESLRAARAAEKAEIEAAMAAIEPLLVATEGDA